MSSLKTKSKSLARSSSKRMGRPKGLDSRLNSPRAERPQFELMMWKLDRLGRSLLQVLNTFWELENKGAKVKVLTEAWFDTTSPMGVFTLQVMGAFAELEKALIRERTVAGLAAAKARGRVGGRDSYATDEQALAVEHLGPTSAAKQLGYTAPASYSRRLAAAKANMAKVGGSHARPAQRPPGATKGQ